MSYTFLKRNVFNFDLKRLTSEQPRISKGSLFQRNPDYTGKKTDTLEAKERTSNKRNPHMASMPAFWA